ncbi:MAG: CidA/LrgA family protein [Actinomycetota bacterium]
MGLSYITLLLVCQLAGEVAVRLLGLPIPGPVVGMLILLAGLVVRGGVPEGLDAITRGLLGNMGVLFVPAAVGVMLHFRLIAEEWLPIGVAILVSTVATIAVTGVVMTRLERRR